MARNKDKQRPVDSSPNVLREALERGGWRFTRQRAAVFQYLCSVKSHPTVEEVYEAIRPKIPHISLATVYNALDALVDCDLANKLTSSDGPARYDCHAEAHYHFRCLKSGKVCDLPTPFDPELIDKLDPKLVDGLKQRGFRVTGYRLEVLGEFVDA
jgi:Fe2+ or Zn2+ uptake regulation protein